MTERLATFELFDDGTIKVLMRERRYDVDTLAGVAAAAVAAADVTWAASHPDARFDWSSAINDPSGNFRRDFVFNAGTDPLGPGLEAIGSGGLAVEADDHRLLERGSFVYDALYEWSKLHLD